jgi:hypothetical protein
MPDDVHPDSAIHEKPFLQTADVLPIGDREERDAYETALDFLVAAAIIALSIFSAGIVSFGIHANGNFSTLGEPWATACATLIGTCLQVGVLAGLHRLFTNTGITGWIQAPRWLLRAPFILLIVAACVAFELFHSLTVQIKGSAGEQLELRLKNDLHRVQAQIGTLDELISNTYAAQIRAHLKLADDAAQGRDDSAISQPGPRYQAEMRRYRDATSRFESLAIRIPAARPLTDTNDIFEDAQARLIALTGKQQDLDTMFESVEHTAMPATVSIGFKHTAAELHRIEKAMNALRYATPQSLAINDTFDLVQNARKGRLEHKQDLFALAYAIAPSAVLVLLALYRQTRSTNTDKLRHKHLEQKEELDLIRKIGKIETELWGAREGWFSVHKLNEKWRRFFG